MSMIIPIFLMNRGCPNRCIFCNERLTAGSRPEKITGETFTETVRAHLNRKEREKGPVQIAFYGGTFTGMERREQRRLLELAAPFLRKGAVDGIRISTRPDGIDAEGLDFLRASGVATVEIGAQSLHDDVLLHSRRGHTAADSVRAVNLLRAKGFETGIHLMAGLPGDSPGRFAETIDRVIALKPDMVRIHPTLVLQNTPLAEDFREGIYHPFALADAVDLCKNALKALTAAGIPVIRLGLQTTRELEKPGAVVAGPFHPAFRSIVETALFLEMADALLSCSECGKDSPMLSPANAGGSPTIRFTLSPADLSNFYGAKRKNIKALQERFGFGAICVSADPLLPRRTLILTANEEQLRTDCSGRITRIRLQECTRHDMVHSVG